MNKLEARLPKGFRDFYGPNAAARDYLIGKIKAVFGLYGFEGLETPIVEYADTLKGKYGAEEKLIYEFEDRGGRMVALRYDQTVPLARFVAQNPELTLPFKRFAIGPVFRADNPQKGRYRQFLQCDADIVGSSSLISDIEILNLALDVYQSLGLKVIVKVNDRAIFEGTDPTFIASIDKMDKIGAKGVREELKAKGLKGPEAKKLLDTLLKTKPTNRLSQIIKSVASPQVRFDPLLARGLSYYTGLIFEVVLKDSASSICGGGRYDNLIGMFAGRPIPAVGFAIGFDRTLQILSEKNLILAFDQPAQVLVTVFDDESWEYSLKIVKEFRSSGISADIYSEPDRLDKQIRFANRKNIPFIAIAGPKEIKQNKVTIKNLQNSDQSTLRIKEAVSLIPKT